MNDFSESRYTSLCKPPNRQSGQEAFISSPSSLSQPSTLSGVELLRKDQSNHAGLGQTPESGRYPTSTNNAALPVPSVNVQEQYTQCLSALPSPEIDRLPGFDINMDDSPWIDLLNDGYEEGQGGAERRGALITGFPDYTTCESVFDSSNSPSNKSASISAPADVDKIFGPITSQVLEDVQPVKTVQNDPGGQPRTSTSHDMDEAIFDVEDIRSHNISLSQSEGQASQIITHAPRSHINLDPAIQALELDQSSEAGTSQSEGCTLGYSVKITIERMTPEIMNEVMKILMIHNVRASIHTGRVEQE